LFEDDPMSGLLTPQEAQRIFAAPAAKGDEIAFRNLAEGCECRAQLMIEYLQTMQVEPGRAWALAVDRPLTFPSPGDPGKFFKWHNHVAPTVAVEGVAHRVLVIDPSTQTGPVTLIEWATSLGARYALVSEQGLSQAEILARQSAQALRGQGLDALIFRLGLDEPPIPELGGSGFRIGPDPAAGPSLFARAEMPRLLRR
jgi:hypothetical protein